MPPEFHDLAQGRISLHDGIVLDARLDAARDLRLLFRCGDLQVGYFDLELRYGALRQPLPAPAQLSELISVKAGALYEELDRNEEGLLKDDSRLRHIAELADVLKRIDDAKCSRRVKSGAAEVTDEPQLERPRSSARAAQKQQEEVAPAEDLNARA